MVASGGFCLRARFVTGTYMYEFDSVLSMAERVCFASRNATAGKDKNGHEGGGQWVGGFCFGLRQEAHSD